MQKRVLCEGPLNESLKRMIQMTHSLKLSLVATCGQSGPSERVAEKLRNQILNNNTSVDGDMLEHLNYIKNLVVQRDQEQRKMQLVEKQRCGKTEKCGV